MALTATQKTTLKAYIEADATLNAQPSSYDGTVVISAHLNALADPAFIVWKTQATINEVGKAFNGGELSGLTTANQTRLQTLAAYLASGVNPSLVSNRQFFDDVFGGAGGALTRAALLVLWKRSARVIEKMFATGTGSDSVPATLVFDGAISGNDIEIARNS